MSAELKEMGVHNSTIIRLRRKWVSIIAAAIAGRGGLRVAGNCDMHTAESRRKNQELSMEFGTC